VNKLVGMFSRFEWFDYRNERHLALIDARLNQNLLVGAAMVNLVGGNVDYAKGDTFIEAFLSLVPRILWPGKPVRAGSPEIVTRFTGMQFGDFTSVGVGQILEFYINFGRWGVILGLLSYGVVVRWVDWQAGKRLASGDGRGFVSWFLPGLALLNAGGSLVEVFGTAAASTLLVLAVNGWAISDRLAGMERRLAGKKHLRSADQASGVAQNGAPLARPNGLGTP
jgi:hypothetical protein